MGLYAQIAVSGFAGAIPVSSVAVGQDKATAQKVVAKVRAAASTLSKTNGLGTV